MLHFSRRRSADSATATGNEEALIFGLLGHYMDEEKHMRMNKSIEVRAALLVVR